MKRAKEAYCATQSIFTAKAKRPLYLWNVNMKKVMLQKIFVLRTLRIDAEVGSVHPTTPCSALTFQLIFRALVWGQFWTNAIWGVDLPCHCKKYIWGWPLLFAEKAPFSFWCSHMYRSGLGRYSQWSWRRRWAHPSLWTLEFSSGNFAWQPKFWPFRVSVHDRISQLWKNEFKVRFCLQ